jgi:phosphoglycolate phosphatase
MKWDLIIFDCDGVLVDSEPISDRLFSRMLHEEGYAIPKSEFGKLFMGFSMKSCVQKVEAYTGKKIPGDFLDRYNEKLFAEFKTSLQPIPGIKEVLDRIPYMKCVASSGEHEKMKISLGVTGLLTGFEGRIFSTTEVERGKPFPDLFLHAAKRCSASPERCVVIEDSIPGMKAGLAAGMTVLAYIGSHNQTNLDEIMKIGVTTFYFMNELPTLL